MKSYVHLKGSGREVTTIEAFDPTNTITVYNLNNVAISGLTVKVKAPISGGTTGINVQGSSVVTINDNSFIGPIPNSGTYAISLDGSSSSLTVTGNIVTGFSNGIIALSPTAITGNTVMGNGVGINVGNTSVTISGNTITGNVQGIHIQDSSSPTIIHNRVTDNSTVDIYVGDGSIPNISSNIYDYITGTTGVGLYNVKSNGDPAPGP